MVSSIDYYEDSRHVGGIPSNHHPIKPRQCVGETCSLECLLTDASVLLHSFLLTFIIYFTHI